MSKKLYEELNIQGIANAIREKNGTQNRYTPSQMPNAILQIHGDPDLETLTVTNNGNYLPSANKDGFSEVAVSVSNSYTNSDEGKVVKNGSLISQTPRAAGIIENGTYDTTENNSVVVNVPSGGGSGDEPTVYWGDEEPLSNLGNDGDVYIRSNIYVFRDSNDKLLKIVNKDYVVTSTSQVLSSHTSVFQKTVEGPAIAIECQVNDIQGYKGPILISPVEDYVKYTFNTTPWGHIDVDDITWYIGSTFMYNQSEDSPTIPTYYDLATDLGNMPLSFDSTYASALVRKFLELAVPSYGSVYVKSNGSWELMTKELNLETLNATDNGLYVPSLGKDGFDKVSVAVEDGEVAMMTAQVTNNSFISDGMTVSSQPVITDGEISANTTSGLTFQWNCDRLVFEFDMNMSGDGGGTVFSFGGSNTDSGVLLIDTSIFMLYANGARFSESISLLLGETYHVKIELAPDTAKLYIDELLVATGVSTYVNNIIAYVRKANQIGVLYNQSAHSEYNKNRINNLKIYI